MCTSFLIRNERAQRTQTIEFSSLSTRWSHLILTQHFTEMDLCVLCFLDKPKTEALFTWRRQNSPTSQVPGACILPLDLERPPWPWFHPFSFFCCLSLPVTPSTSPASVPWHPVTAAPVSAHLAIRAPALKLSYLDLNR